MWGSPLGCIVMLTLSMLLAPLAADAQPPKQVHRIGVLLTNASALWFQPLLAAFRRGLRDLGYVEGQNLVIEYRSAEGHAERLPTLAAELVQLQVEVIVAPGPSPGGTVRRRPPRTRGPDRQGRSPPATLPEGQSTLLGHGEGSSASQRGARCGKTARRDLCGGRRVTGVPTATASEDLQVSWCIRINSAVARIVHLGLQKER